MKNATTAAALKKYRTPWQKFKGPGANEGDRVWGVLLVDARGKWIGRFPLDVVDLVLEAVNEHQRLLQIEEASRYDG